MGELHIVVVPMPAQGHITPLMQLSRTLTTQGFRITFVNTHFNHNRLQAPYHHDVEGHMSTGIRLVSVSDGLEDEEDRKDPEKLASVLFATMPANIGRLLKSMMMEDGDRVDCVIVDLDMPSVVEVARQLGIPTAAFWPASASTLVACSSLDDLIHQHRVVDQDGNPINQDGNHHSAPTPAMDSQIYFWTHMGDRCAQQICFEAACRIGETANTIDWILCNSAYDLEPEAFTLAPNIKPIGPLSIIDKHPKKFVANLWPEDAECLKWLDQQAPKSVIYVAFGSFTTLGEEQFRELALGLELSNMPFLWVVRPDIVVETQLDLYPQRFSNLIACRGRLVGWAPQQNVLGHEAVACFLSHCGWNSTLEGLSNGVPFLCWPNFTDQFTNESYICDMWKTGLRLEKDQSGIIPGKEIKRKVKMLLCDGGFKDRAHGLKKLAHNSVAQDGLSAQNLESFTKWLKHM